MSAAGTYSAGCYTCPWLSVAHVDYDAAVTELIGHMAETKHFPPRVIEDMRSWIADCPWGDLEGQDVSELSAIEVVGGVRRFYEGGLVQFLSDACYDFGTLAGAAASRALVQTCRGVAHDYGGRRDSTGEVVEPAEVKVEKVDGGGTVTSEACWRCGTTRITRRDRTGVRIDTRYNYRAKVSDVDQAACLDRSLTADDQQERPVKGCGTCGAWVRLICDDDGAPTLCAMTPNACTTRVFRTLAAAEVTG